MILYDTQQNKVINAFEINRPPIWPTNTGDTVAYMSAPHGVIKECETLSSVIIHSNGKKETIEKAAHPELSADGKYIVFTRSFKPRNSSEKESDYISLILRERATGKERNLSAAGVASDFSPDSKRLVYVAFKSEGQDGKAYVETLDLMTGDKKRFGEVNMLGESPNKRLVAHPRWINDNKIIYTGKAKEGKDSEIFIATRNGGLSQVTDNNLEEIFANMTPDRRVCYLEIGPKHLNYQIAEQSVMGWKSKQNTKTVINIAGDQAILLGNNDNLYITPVSNLKTPDESKIVNISLQAKKRREEQDFANVNSKPKTLFEALNTKENRDSAKGMIEVGKEILGIGEKIIDAVEKEEEKH